MSEVDMAEVAQIEVEGSSDPFDDVVEEGDFVDEAEATENTEEADNSEDDSPEQDDQSIEDMEESDDAEKTEDEPENEEDRQKDQEEPEIDVEEIHKQLESGEYKVDINGEEIALKDLKNDYIGQKEISKRFTEYDKKIKSHESDVNEINTYINTFADKLRNGDSVGAMSYFGQFAGIAPYQIKAQLMEALRPEIERQSQMSQSELQAEQLRQENEYLQQQRESDTQRYEQEQAQRELEAQTNEFRQAHNIDEATWETASNLAQENLVEGEELTPEHVANVVEYQRSYEQADAVTESFGDKLGENREDIVEQLVDIKERYPEFDQEDLKEVVNEYLRMEGEKSAEQKLAKKVSKNKPKQQQSAQPQEEADEIDPNLEDWL